MILYLTNLIKLYYGGSGKYFHKIIIIVDQIIFLNFFVQWLPIVNLKKQTYNLVFFIRS